MACCLQWAILSDGMDRKVRFGTGAPNRLGGYSRRAQAEERGALPQMVEQWNENPCVPASVPGGRCVNPLFWIHFDRQNELKEARREIVTPLLRLDSDGSVSRSGEESVD